MRERLGFLNVNIFFLFVVSNKYLFIIGFNDVVFKVFLFWYDIYVVRDDEDFLLNRNMVFDFCFY